MSLLNNVDALVATSSLAVQIIDLFLLIYGFMLKSRGHFRRHGFIMTSAVLLHLAFIFGIMIPSFVFAVFPKFVVIHFYGITSIVSLIHVPFGAFAISLGVWLVAAWRFQDVEGCFKRRRFMRAAMVAWLVSLFLGIALYTILYWAVLMG